MMLESVLFIPFILLLLIGMVQFGRLTYTYYTLKKTLYAAARYISVQQAVNFCDPTSDAQVQAGINLAVTGTSDASADAQVTNLTPDMITITTECVDPVSGAAGDCNTSGCDNSAGGPRPDFLVLSIPNGYQFTLHIPYVALEPILLKPMIRIPFGGTGA
jgi:Flp pilus assembly protein TadG